MKTTYSLRTLLAATLASTFLLQTSISYADDTEIFFGGSAIDSSIQPNVLFILDNSGSMSGTRMTQLKSAFNTIINNAGKINVGIMSLNTSPRMLSTVKDINQSINVKLSTPALIASGDDATHLSSGSTNISDATLIMGSVKNADSSGASISSINRSLGTTSTYSTDNASYYVITKSSVDYACSAKIVTTGTVCTGAKTQINSTTATSGNDGVLLFRNLNVPKGVTITSAKLILTPTSTSANSGKQPPFLVKLENTKTAAAFNSDTSISARNFTTAALQTTTVTAPLTSGEIVLDIKTALTSLTALAPTANPLADVAVRLRGTTSTSYSWFLGDGAANSPRLEIAWTGSENVTRTTGLRFQNVAIPKGATITSARIDFVPAASDDRPVAFAVTAQNIADAPIFTTAEDFTGRTKTATSSTWTPTEWRTSSPQVYVEGPIVTSLVQTVIDSNSDWCGNNSMAFFLTPTGGSGNRTAFSVDAGNDLQPVLNVSYTGGDNGCLNPILDITVVDPKDDAYQSANNQNPVLTDTTLPFSNIYIASRFQQIPVKQGATVKEAQLIVTPNNTTTATASVYLEKADTSAAFSTNKNDLSSRSLTSNPASCTFTPSVAGTAISCADANIKTQLQSIFSRSGWVDGNSLTVMLKPTANTALALRTRETSAAAGMTLRIKLASGGLGANSYTVRDYTNGIVQSLVANGTTPLVPVLNDAAGYLTQTPGKHTGSNPSPISSSCQANYLVLLTDGEANGTTTAAQTGIATLSGSSCTGDATDADEKCGRSAVKWMATADLADYDGLNNVKTSTIGFNTSGNVQATKFLNDLASLGGGKAYQAENASDLVSAFDAIIQSALATNTTFVNTSAPVNSFNRADNLDELYFALFRPSEYDRWAGNLKRYRLKTEGAVATIVDADDAPAIDVNTGFFKSTARSFWTTGQDGSDIAKGGAALKLPLPAARNLFTYIGTPPTSSGTALIALDKATSSTTLSGAALGNPSMTTVERASLLDYIRGLDTDNITPRYALGDPIHSSPRLVTYGCTTYTGEECTSPDISAIMGSNEGFIHAFSTSDSTSVGAGYGAEQFAFMPEALLPNIKQLRDNAKSTSAKPRLYGMDNTVSLWVNDANNNGVIYGGKDPVSGATLTGLNSNEFVYAYASMGRGGRNIYALDITDRAAPKILWQIIGGSTAGFERLGQTWSTPVKTRIDVGGTIKDVLIFGGGYDADQDSLNTSTSVYTPDDMGNAIYIVDAKTGAKIWSASQNNLVGSHDLTLSNMKYSIPGAIRVIDIQEENGVLVNDEKKLADQFFVGDMGGQVWRFYINNGSSGSALVTAAGSSNNGLFASIGGTSASNARRFYNEPDVAVLNVNGKRSLAVSIGSGYRGHPRNEYIQDRFYSFRTDKLFKTASEGTLTESNLYDASLNLVQAGDISQKQVANTAFAKTTGGWYITLPHSGEKVLSRALTAGGVIYFNTYEPSTSSAICSASVGKNRSYSTRILDATPASVEVGGNGTPDQRADLSNSGGISGDPQLFCSGNDCWALPDPSIPPKKIDTPPLGKTYWMDNSDF